MGLTRAIDQNLEILGAVNAAELSQNGTPVVISGSITDVVEISQAAYDALGAGRPAGRLYLVTS